MRWLDGLGELPGMPPRYNIAPTQKVAVARATRDPPPGRTAPYELVMMRWGYVPPWAKDPDDGPLIINARSETLSERPAFRAAVQTHRCLLPADGFFEWETTKQGKHPRFFHMADRSLFGMAGLWSTHERPDGTTQETCTILTCAANDMVAPLVDRMPVILPRERYDEWLDPKDPDVDLDLLRPFPADRMAAYPVTPRVNKPEYDAPACVEPGGQQALF